MKLKDISTVLSFYYCEKLHNIIISNNNNNKKY